MKYNCFELNNKKEINKKLKEEGFKKYKYDCYLLRKKIENTYINTMFIGAFEPLNIVFNQDNMFSDDLIGNTLLIECYGCPNSSDIHVKCSNPNACELFKKMTEEINTIFIEDYKKIKELNNPPIQELMNEFNMEE